MRTKEQAAYLELKLKITDLMFRFTNKYAAPGEDCLYPQCGSILVDVLQDCLQEAREQIGKTPFDDEEDEDEDLNESQEPQEDSAYTAYRRMVAGFKMELDTIDQKMIDMQVAFDDAQRASQTGVQNVWNKFVEIEKRQIEIEDLLKSDRIVDLVKKIPTESDIRAMLMKIENTDTAKLTRSIEEMRDSLQEMIDRFTW